MVVRDLNTEPVLVSLNSIRIDGTYMFIHLFWMAAAADEGILEGSDDGEGDDGDEEDEDIADDADMMDADDAPLKSNGKPKPTSSKPKSKSKPKPISPIMDENDDKGLEEEEEYVVLEPTTANATGTPKSLLHLLTPPLIALARPTPQLSFPPPSLPSVHPPTTSVLGAIHVRALECLNNLFVGVKERELIDPSAAASESPADQEKQEEEKEVVQGALGVWEQMWSAELLGAVGAPPVDSASLAVVPGGKAGLAGLFGSGQERRSEMWSVAVGVLWGLARMSRGALVRFLLAYSLLFFSMVLISFFILLLFCITWHMSGR